MIDYQQPDFYRFNQDSLLLVEYIVDRCQKLPVKKVLDVCAGSGIIGIELCLKLRSVQQVDFLELQEEFKPYLELNIQHFLKNIKTNIYIKKYQDFQTETKYDLIVANPPYFVQNAGRPSPDIRKQQCRTFTDGNINDFCHRLQSLKQTSEHVIFCYPEGLEKIVPYVQFETKINSSISIYSIIN